MTIAAKLIALLRLLRHHRIKNGVVLFPLFFSGKLFYRERINKFLPQRD